MIDAVWRFGDGHNYLSGYFGAAAFINKCQDDVSPVSAIYKEFRNLH